MLCPQPRGVLSTMVRASLLRRAELDPDVLARQADEVPSEDLLRDGDVQLALWMLYELHFGGFDDVSGDLEWDPGLLRARGVLERRLEGDLRRRAHDRVQEALDAEGALPERIFDMVAADDGPRLAAYLHRRATATQIAEFLRERTIFHLKESDPQSLVLARVGGRAKTALAELLHDEFGAGRPERLHATMFADGLAGAGLDSSSAPTSTRCRAPRSRSTTPCPCSPCTAGSAAPPSAISRPSRRPARRPRAGSPPGSGGWACPSWCGLLRRARRGRTPCRAARSARHLRGAEWKQGPRIKGGRAPRGRPPACSSTASPAASCSTAVAGLEHGRTGPVARVAWSRGPVHRPARRTTWSPDAGLCPGGPMLLRGVQRRAPTTTADLHGGDPASHHHLHVRPAPSGEPWCDGTHKAVRSTRRD